MEGVERVFHAYLTNAEYLEFAGLFLDSDRSTKSKLLVQPLIYHSKDIGVYTSIKPGNHPNNENKHYTVIDDARARGKNVLASLETHDDLIDASFEDGQFREFSHLFEEVKDEAFDLIAFRKNMDKKKIA